MEPVEIGDHPNRPGNSTSEGGGSAARVVGDFLIVAPGCEQRAR
jgi:hypothetical protein